MIKKIKLKIEKNKFWVYPTFYIIIALILAVISIVIDKKQLNILTKIPRIFLTSGNLARVILVGLVSALLTITTFTFSTIMVVLSMYSSQFSPRVIKNFLSNKVT